MTTLWQRLLQIRRLTEDQRLAEAFALTNGVLSHMHDGVMAELDTADAATGWQEIRRRSERLRSVRSRSVLPPVGTPAIGEWVAR